MTLSVKYFSSALLAFVLVRRGASISRGAVRASLQDFVETPAAARVNFAVVSFDKHWQESDNSLMRHLPWPRTTWIFKKGGLKSYISENSAADRSTVAMVPSLRVDWHNIENTVRTTLNKAFVRWIVASGNATFSYGAETASVLPACIQGTSQRKHIGSHIPNSKHDDHTFVYDYRPHKELGLFKRSTKKTSLKGKVMKIACLRSKQFVDHDICFVYSYLFGLLEATNVSLEYQFHSNWSTMLEDLYCENTDMVVLIMPLGDYTLASSTFGEIILVSETFYALESKTQAPSLFDTTLRSALTIAATTASLTICATVLVLVGGPHVRERAQSETLFLLAILLATSTSLPRPSEWPRVQRAIYLSWLLAMVPLSQYFRCELTSLVTVGCPASSLDTLEELEAALDTGLAAPCVPRESASLDGIMYWDHPTALGKKLRASLKKHRDQLVTANLLSCFKCATRTGSVCYAHRMPPSLMKRMVTDVAVFEQNFMTRACSMPLRKSFPLRDAFRAFLQRVREAGLLSSPYCKQDVVCTRPSRIEGTETEKPLFELQGFFAFYFVLLCGTVCVLVSEVLFARLYKSGFFRRRTRPWR